MIIINNAAGTIETIRLQATVSVEPATKDGNALTAAAASFLTHHPIASTQQAKQHFYWPALANATCP